MSDEEYDMIFKVVIIGDSGVGKSNITTRYLKDEFNTSSKATVGVEFGAKKLIFEKTNIKVQIWDTAGQERYKSITNAYYKGSKGAFIIYDITKRESFENVEKWLSELKKGSEDNITVILIGNKSDLNEERQVSIDEGKIKAQDYGKKFKLF